MEVVNTHGGKGDKFHLNYGELQKKRNEQLWKRQHTGDNGYDFCQN